MRPRRGIIVEPEWQDYFVLAIDILENIINLPRRTSNV